MKRAEPFLEPTVPIHLRACPACCTVTWIWCVLSARPLTDSLVFIQAPALAGPRRVLPEHIMLYKCRRRLSEHRGLKAAAAGLALTCLTAHALLPLPCVAHGTFHHGAPWRGCASKGRLPALSRASS